MANIACIRRRLFVLLPGALALAALLGPATATTGISREHYSHEAAMQEDLQAAGHTLTWTPEEPYHMQEISFKPKEQPGSGQFIVSVSEGVALPPEWKRGGHAGGLAGGRIVIAGGTQWSADKQTKHWLRSTAVFSEGKWQAGPDLPGPLAYAMFACDSRCMYIAGGSADGSSVLQNAYRLCSPGGNPAWEPLPSLPVAAAYGAGAMAGGKFYVACGQANKVNTNRMWVLDVQQAAGRWRECAPLPGPGRSFPALVTAGRYLYLLGGLAQMEPLTPLKDAYRYDPEKDVWTRLNDLPLEGYAWVGHAIDSTHILLTGRAYGKVDTGIWILDLDNMHMTLAGHHRQPATTAPLVQAGPGTWWLVAGEPDANRNRSETVSVVRIAQAEGHAGSRNAAKQITDH